MKSFLISTAVALLATQIHASPTPANIKDRQFAVQVTFQGAPPEAAFYTLSIPADGTVIAITNPLSISHISSAGGATCGFTGIDGSDTVVVGAQTVDVGPPQTQISGSCRAF